MLPETRKRRRECTARAIFRRSRQSLTRGTSTILCVRRWHVTCCPLRDACTGRSSRLRGSDMDENAGNLIRTLRQKLGMTQEEFAHEIAVTVSTVNRWENAHAEPSKLAWKAIQDLARKRGLNDDMLSRAGFVD